MNGTGPRYRQPLKQGNIIDRTLATSIVSDVIRRTALGKVSSTHTRLRRKHTALEEVSGVKRFAARADVAKSADAVAADVKRAFRAESVGAVAAD